MGDNNMHRHFHKYLTLFWPFIDIKEEFSTLKHKLFLKKNISSVNLDADFMFECGRIEQTFWKINSFFHNVK